jgi:hypothetical protein
MSFDISSACEFEHEWRPEKTTGWSAPMFTVKWIVRHRENNPVHVEESVLTDLDNIVDGCKERVYGMRLKYITSPPDGFVVFDERGREVRRWLGPLPRKS